MKRASSPPDRNVAKASLPGEVQPDARSVSSTPAAPAAPGMPSVELAGQDRFSRRQLLVYGAGLGACTVATCWSLGRIGRAEREERGRLHGLRVPFGAADLAPGTARIVDFPDARSKAVLIRRRNQSWVAFAQRCPHLGCPVAYDPGGVATQGANGADERMVCSCHDGAFELARGQGIAGPPRSLPPLPQVTLLIEGGEVFGTGFADGP